MAKLGRYLRALTWGSLVAVTFAGLGAVLLATGSPARGGFTVLLLAPLPIGVATAVFVHAIDAILIGMVVGTLTIGLAVRLAARYEGLAWLQLSAPWLIGGLVVGALVGSTIRFFWNRHASQRP